MDKNEAGSSDPAQDQSGASGDDPVANQETEQTVTVRVESTWSDAERLAAARLGVELLPEIVFQLPLGSSWLEGINDQGEGVLTDDELNFGGLQYIQYRLTPQHIADAGGDTGAAAVRLLDGELAKRRCTKAVVQAGLASYRYTYTEGDTPEVAVARVREVTEAIKREDDEREAAAQAVRDERDAEVRAAGLPDGYEPSCIAADNEPYGVLDPDQPYLVPRGRRYQTVEQAVEAAQRHADEQAAKAARIADREAWIAEHGSDGLQDRVARGYNCQRRYMDERLAAELPGWTISKWDGLPDWELKSRVCPTDAALVLEDEAKAAGYEATTHWAVWEARYDEYHEDEEQKGEVVVVEDFHGYLIYHET